MAMHPALKYAFRHALKKAPPLGRRVSWLRAHEQDTPEQIAAAQEQFLRCTLQTAANHLPAYSHLKGRIPREGLREFLHTLPIVDKPTLIADRALYYPNQGRARPWYSIGRTSGSTGTPLDVFRNYDSTRWEQAFCTQHGMWTGWRPGQMQGVLRGDLVVPTSQDKPPYWLHDRAGRQLILSIRHLSKCSIHDVVRATREHGPQVLRAYPSGAYTLALLAAEAGLELHFRSVITSSETLLPQQRQLIERVFSTKVYDHYGMAERVALGFECEHGRLHVHPHYSHVEIVDDAGRPTEGEGFIVGTTFHNTLMPLVRYRLTDRAKWGRGACPCGRSYPHFEHVAGRLGDMLFDKDRRPISPTLLCFAFMAVPHIAQGQIAQVGEGKLDIRVVPTREFGHAQLELLLARIQTVVSARIQVGVHMLDEIPLQASGKFKFVSQEFYKEPQRTQAQVTVQ